MPMNLNMGKQILCGRVAGVNDYMQCGEVQNQALTCKLFRAEAVSSCLWIVPKKLWILLE